MGALFLAGAVYVQSQAWRGSMTRRQMCEQAMTPLAQALSRYASLNEHRLPDELADLLRQVYIDPWSMISPFSNQRPPPGPTLMRQAKYFALDPNRYCSYAYTGRGIDVDQTPNAVMLILPTERSGLDAALILRANGSMAWVSPPDLTSAAPAFNPKPVKN